MMDWAPRQMALLERLQAHGFELVQFPLQISSIGVKKGNCGALLKPEERGGIILLGEPSYLVAGNLSVRVLREGRHWFVWKKEQLPVTPNREAELQEFARALSELIADVI